MFGLGENTLMDLPDQTCITQPLCTACGATELVFFGSRLGYTYSQCKACKTLQLNPMPNHEAIAHAYQNEYSQAGHYQGDPGIRNIAAKRVFTYLADAYEKFASPETQHFILDYGCGWGGMLDELRSRDIPCEGADYSSEMTAYTRGKSHVVYNKEIIEFTEPDKYSCVVMSAVFEHLLDHYSTMTALKKILKPNGLLICFQPTAHFAIFFSTLFRIGIKSLPLPQLHEVICPPWHTVLFTIKGMRMLAEKHGFEVLEILPGPVQSGPGFAGIIKNTLNKINTWMWPIFGEKWPLCICHVFILRKKTE